MPASTLHRKTNNSPAAPLVKLNALITQGKFKQALPICRRLAGKNKKNLQLSELLGDCLWNLGKHQEGLDALEKTCLAWPDTPALWGKFGSRLMNRGELDRAYKAFATMHRLDPQSGFALTAMNLIHTFPINSDHTEALKDRAEDNTLPTPERISVLNALGRIYSKGEDPETAMQYFLRSKAETPGEYFPIQMEAKIAQQKATFAPAKMPSLPEVPSKLPRYVFVTGLPRSGTTLLETLLINHQEVATVGESLALMQTRKAIQQIVTGKAPNPGRWDWCETLSPEVLAAARSAFAKQSLAELATPAPVVLDKMPNNCLEMGFAQMILPEARFIFMLRHPLDVGLSLLSNDFTTGHPYTKSMESIAHYIRATYDSLEDFKGKMGKSLRIQSFRALIEDPEPQMRAVLEHMQLPWDDACLTPASTGGVVRTASVVQVRQGLNQKGLGKWKLFEKQLNPLIEALGGWEWIRDWEERDQDMKG